ncbi:PI-PLC X domain-containing protein 1-like [Nilaparvata lugens]|uniref:PI-PLC X domain-containing protein 1-like n=1 Tax=Nilaparvata lugens TaxID=108931 RepID=UPI00193EAC97|nr:PI-PLC X domain-containing protein 1-like [Nilaparvata lugens]
MHWNPQLFDKVGLFTSDPSVDKTARAVIMIRNTASDYDRGYYETSLSIGSPTFPAGWEKNSTEERVPGANCLPFWIVGWKAGLPLDIRCLMINPTWMNDHSFWINHDLIKVRPLVPMLKDIRKFLEAATSEIIILDFHRFPVGFSGRHHRHHSLVRILERELGEFAFPYQEEFPMLEEIWNLGRNLIISYGDDVTVEEYPWLWPPIKQMWGNKQTPLDLYTFLHECMVGAKFNSSHPGLWAAMAQLTPAPFDLLFQPDFSLRHLTHQVSRNLTQLCQESWWDKANIFATDFFLENNIVNVAIEANIKRAGFKLVCEKFEGSGMDSILDWEEEGFVI